MCCSPPPRAQTVTMASGVMDKLGQPGHYTLFAPTNDAFDKLGPDFLERIMSDKAVIAGKHGGGAGRGERVWNNLGCG